MGCYQIEANCMYIPYKTIMSQIDMNTCVAYQVMHTMTIAGRIKAMPADNIFFLTAKCDKYSIGKRQQNSCNC